jgi:IS605 OrfB family transposase
MFVVVCNFLSEEAFEHQKFNKIVLQRLCYQQCKERFPGFSSQLIVRAIGVVCDSYRRRQDTQTVFSSSVAVYDARVLSWKDMEASIWTVDGRIRIPIQVWNQDLFNRPKGQSDLVCRNGMWFLQTTVELPEVPKKEASTWLGVDLGVVNLAVTSDGQSFSGDLVEKKRQKYFRHRHRLQKRNTKSARRKVRKTGNREARFRKDVNHVISKAIVCKAEGTSCGLALEKLTHINKRTTVRKGQRNQRLSWSFGQLRTFIEYKANEKGIPVRIVSAVNTSKECSKCGHIDKRNRKSQADFVCLECGFSLNADLNAALNISNRAAVNQPIVCSKKVSYKPTALVVGC